MYMGVCISRPCVDPASSVVDAEFSLVDAAATTDEDEYVGYDVRRPR
jgi:hypothetical protein